MKRRALRHGVLIIMLVAGVAVYLALTRHETAEHWASRKVQLQAAAMQAQPLVAAIAAYSLASGHPPATLRDLVPKYLKNLPAVAVDGCDRIGYRTFRNGRTWVVWYDLGSRQGAAYKGTSHYADGDPGHSILVFSLDADNKIARAVTDRMPKVDDQLDFDPVRWKAGEQRLQMAESLADTYRLFGMPKNVFEQLLGPPDGMRAIDNSPWELRSRCSTGLLNHDVFIYRPSQKYPKHLYGGHTELIDGWAYVHS